MLMRVSRLAVAMGILIACGAASSAEHAGRATRDQSAEMEKFYTGGRTKTGEFTDKLVWLCTDRVQGQPAPKQDCESEGHRHALAMSGGEMVHPLLAGTKQIDEQLTSPTLHDKEIVVHGKYYPSSGVILVIHVSEKK
ncbi:MAG TPA: hypothetical protein VFD84_03350 [Candidatus Binatia bacterium]|nr:hypothetical protein [Candidatus Binatia bacterium]